MDTNPAESLAGSALLVTMCETPGLLWNGILSSAADEVEVIESFAHYSSWIRLHHCCVRMTFLNPCCNIFRFAGQG
jgi:hypothetical protein